MNELSEVLFENMRSKGAIDNPSSIQLGEILSVEPLIIKVGELQVDRDNLLVAEHLLTHKRKFSLSTISASGNVSCSNGSGTLNNISIQDGELTFQTSLKNGDIVVCYPVFQGQKYLVLEKVI